MISIKIFRNKKGDVFGFEANNHSQGLVCAAVSILLLNAVNSIECFTEQELICDADESGGYLKLILPQVRDGETSHDAALLLNSALLGVKGAAEEYPGEIEISDDCSNGRCNCIC